MSFYDSASLVFLPSGGAGKDGKAYSIKPVPEYGNELVTNGGFDTDSDWELGTGWSISGGVASVVNTADQQLRQYIPIVSGKTYRLKFDILSLQQGAFRVFIRDGGNPSYFLTDAQGSIINFSSPQSVNITFTATQDNDKICIYPTGTTTGSVDNVSLKEVIVDGDFTFSRGSNLTATRVDSNGLIEKGRENLLLQSNQFDTTWSLGGATLTSGQSGYDGSSDAWLIQNTGNLLSYVFQSVSQSGVQTFSIYAKGGNVDWMRVNAIVSGSNANAYFDITNGTIGTSSAAVIDKTITPVGNSFYRISLSFNDTISQIRVQIADGDGDENTPLGSNIYIQDAQLEIGLVATEYIESGATTGLAGILEDSPRFDYSGGATCPSLLLEPSRTNLMTYSEIFQGTSSGFWRVFDNGTIEPNYGTSPEGLQNSAKIGTSGGSNDFVYNSITISSGTTYTLSCFVKNIDATESLIYGVNSSNNDLTWSGSTLTNVVGGDFESFGDGWYRIWITTTSTSTSAITRIYSDRNGGTGSIEVYGFQIEQGSYPTSYIPNHSGGSVTRNGDTSNTVSIPSLIGQTEGTFLLDFEYTGFELGAAYNWIALESENGHERILIYKNANSTDLLVYLSANNQMVFVKSIATISANTRYKIAFRYNTGNQAIYLNGSQEHTSAHSYTRGSDLSRVTFNESSNPASCRVHKTLVFQKGLSNTDCEILTGTSYESFAAMATALNYTTYE